MAALLRMPERSQGLSNILSIITRRGCYGTGRFPPHQGLLADEPKQLGMRAAEIGAEAGRADRLGHRNFERSKSYCQRLGFELSAFFWHECEFWLNLQESVPVAPGPAKSGQIYTGAALA
jgi:hypothetical protein